MLRVLVLLLLIFSHLSWAESPALHFTAVPDQDKNILEQRYQLLTQYLQNALGVQVKYIPAENYQESIELFKSGIVQMGWFGGFTGLKARQSITGSKAIAQGFEDQRFRSYFIAHKSVDVEPTREFPTALLGRTFTFGSRLSTSGRLMPEYFIRKHLLRTSGEAFSQINYSGGHSKTIKLVESGAFEVGVVNYKVWVNEMELGHIDLNKVQVVWETPPYPDYQWSVRGDMDNTFGDGFTDKVQKTFINITESYSQIWCMGA